MKPFALAIALCVSILPAAAQAPDGASSALPRAALIEGPAPGPLVVRGAHYVPANSTMRAGDGRTRIELAMTLSIHNASESLPLVVERLDYYDGSGHLVRRHLHAPVAVKPFGTLEVFVAKSDVGAGTGANFVVGWGATGAIAEPVIEAVMIGEYANQSYSFVSTGRRITLVGGESGGVGIGGK